jgi:hypothetical protein
MIGSVECLPTELQLGAFHQAPVLHHRSVGAKLTRSEHEVLGAGAEGPDGIVVEGGIIEVAGFDPIPMGSLASIERLSGNAISAIALLQRRDCLTGM